MPPLDLRLLRDYQEWNTVNKGQLRLWDYVGRAFDPQVACSFSKLFWPDVLDRDGCLFLAEQFHEEHYLKWKQKLQDDKTAIEKVINHLHLDMLFPSGHGASTVGLLNYLGHTPGILVSKVPAVIP